MAPVGIAALVLLACLCRPAAAARPVDAVNNLKAALIYKVSKFVTWPTEKMENASLFRICITQAKPLNGALAGLEGRSVGGVKVDVHRMAAAGGGEGSCHVLFVAGDGRADRDVGGQHGVLTISDREGFALRGGMIEIVRKRKGFGFRVDPAAARSAGLVIASPLLQLSTVVGKEKP